MSDDISDIIGWFRHISETREVKHIWKDGVYQGCSVTYTNPLHPDLRTIFYPYIPLIIHGQPTEQATKEYFERHGFRVPPDC